MPASNADHLLSKARLIDVGVTTQTFTDSVGALEGNNRNLNDFYKFTLNGRSSFNLTLDGLSADCDVNLIKDANANLEIDAEELIGASTWSGIRAETIQSTLDAGTYYIQVYPYQNAVSNYNLRVSAIPVDDAGNTLSTAKQISIGAISSTHTDWVGSNDTNDYYKFSLNNTNQVSVLLKGLINNADLELLNTKGELLTSSSYLGTVNESISYTLNAGSYYIRVFNNGGDTFYDLSVVATAPVTNAKVLNPAAPGTVTDAQKIVEPSSNTPIVNSTNAPLQIITGTLRADTFTLQSGFKRFVFSGNGNVDFGSGLRDTLDLRSIASTTVNFNFADTKSGGVLFNLGNGTRLFDALTLSDGTEILFEGIERINFADTTQELAITPNDPLFSQQWNLHMMGVQTAWRFTTGSQGVLVGITDTGLGVGSNGGLHPDLRVENTIGIGNNYPDELSTSHGTTVQGVIAAASNNGVGISGINWNSPVYQIDVIASNGTGDAGDLTLFQAVQSIINQANANGQRAVINMSLSGGSSSALEQLIARNQNNALFAIASGNGNTNTISSPANLAKKYSNVMAVGAVWGTRDWYGNSRTPGDRISYANWWGSNYGDGLTLVAPSEFVSTSATQQANGAFTFGYDHKFNGTSAATPNVAGVASLVWSVNQSLSAGDIKTILSQTATDLGAAGDDLVYGNGMVNADKAIRRALALAREAQATPAVSTPVMSIPVAVGNTNVQTTVMASTSQQPQTRRRDRALLSARNRSRRV